MNSNTKHALILAGLQVGLSLLFFGLGIEKMDSVQKLSGLASLGLNIYMCYFTIKHYRDIENEGYLSIWEGIKKGFRLSAISGAIGSVYFLIYAKILNPGFMEYMRLKQEIELEESGLSQQQIEQSMKMMNAFSGPTVGALFAFLGALLLGFVASLIIAAILKKESAESWK